MSRQRVRQEGETCVILLHAVHMHAAVLVATDALPFIASLLNPRWVGGRTLVLCHVAQLLCNRDQIEDMNNVFREKARKKQNRWNIANMSTQRNFRNARTIFTKKK